MAALTRLSVWPPLPPRVYLTRTQSVPFPLQERGCQLFALGRHALWSGVRGLGLEAGDEILVPAYHHGSEVEALAEAGLSIRFYSGSEDLTPTETELETLLGPRTRALLVIHYLGFPQEVGHWRRWCDDRGLFLIEDAAQAWLARDVDGRPVGSSGDLAIFCLYKTFGVPDGAALISRHPPDGTPGNVRMGLTETARRHMSWLLSRTPTMGRRSSRGGSADGEFDLGDPSTRASHATTFLLRRLEATHAATGRRSNYAQLLRNLGSHVVQPFANLPDGAVPFVFPLRTPNKLAVLEALTKQGIHAFDFWSVGHRLLDPHRFPAVADRRRGTIGLPVHQELRPRDVERIAATVIEALGDRE
jgi:dTDP-4-amino-4,6-dideoxygalactose transaminase